MTNISCDKEVVQIVFVGCLTVLGAVAIIIDGDAGNAMAIAVAGAIGYLAKGIVERMNKVKEKDDDEMQ